MKIITMYSCSRTLIPLAFLCLFAGTTAAQSVGINNDGSTPNPSAILDVKSSNQGLLIPRMTSAERQAISVPAVGLTVYDTNTGSFWYFNGGAWRNMNDFWTLTGNSNIDPANHFIGSRNNAPLMFRVNNAHAGFIAADKANIGLGYQALPFSVTGIGNTAMGSHAMNHSTTGEQNVAIGYGSLYYNTGGSSNTALGFDALFNNTTGNSNVAVGHFALASNSTGIRNVGMGKDAMYMNSIGTDNTAIGYRALFNNVASFNTGLGASALDQNSTGDNNTAVGYQAMYYNLTGRENTAVGRAALLQNTIGNSNVAVGIYTLTNNTEGNSNIATGYSSLISNQTGSYNVAYGALTLRDNIVGENNTAVGQAALLKSTGSSNTAVGHDALVDNEAGERNTAIGAKANVSNGSLTNATAIGYGAVVNASNKVRIGNSAVTVIEGQVAFTTPSDGRFKFNVQEDVKGLDFIMRLRPVTYQFDVKRFDGNDAAGNAAPPDSLYAEATSMRRTGFIAQEVEAAATASGFQFSGITKPATTSGHYGLSYESFVAPIVKGMQEQQQQIQKQQEQIDALKKENEELKKMVHQLLERVK